jgi:hypothetical protein
MWELKRFKYIEDEDERSCGFAPTSRITLDLFPEKSGMGRADESGKPAAGCRKRSGKIRTIKKFRKTGESRDNF